MNPENPICIKCPFNDPCRLESRSAQIIEAYNAGEITEKEVTHRVSTMTLEARQIGCPQSEIARIRKHTLTQVDPVLAQKDNLYRNRTFLQKPPEN